MWGGMVGERGVHENDAAFALHYLAMVLMYLHDVLAYEFSLPLACINRVSEVESDVDSRERIFTRNVIDAGVRPRDASQ